MNQFKYIISSTAKRSNQNVLIFAKIYVYEQFYDSFNLYIPWSFILVSKENYFLLSEYFLGIINLKLSTRYYNLFLIHYNNDRKDNI